MLSFDRSDYLWVVGLFFIGFLLVPFAQLGGMAMMPGDVGDARLNNYFLENIYQYLTGGSPSLVHFEVFYPFPYVLGFSDNLFGSFPVYLLARFFGGQADTSFQVWYLFGFVANYCAAYYALRKLNGSVLAASVGALIFAFALPVTSHTGHAQLLYRFGVPLSIVSFISFLDGKEWKCLAISASWLVWQFYCTIYIGFFLLLTLVVISGVYLVRMLWRGRSSARAELGAFAAHWSGIRFTSKLVLGVAILILIALLLLLFYPYVQVSDLYAAKRPWSEIAKMLPRLQSYLMSDQSWIWSYHSRRFSDIPIRHEHNMFFGAVPVLLAIAGYYVGRKRSGGLAFGLLSGAFATLVLITLYIGGFSLWSYFAQLPLASSIRAMARIDVVMLFPVAFFSTIAIDALRQWRGKWAKATLVVVLSLLVIEFSAISSQTSEKTEWRRRLVAIEQRIPDNLPDNPILFFGQVDGPFFADEIDAMWITLQHRVATLNGFSGYSPPGYSLRFGSDCSELYRRIKSYQAFIGQSDNIEMYHGLLQRVVPIGIDGCNPLGMLHPPVPSTVYRPYTAREFRKLSVSYKGVRNVSGQLYVDLNVSNSNKFPIFAVSKRGTPVRLSWRYIDSSGRIISRWDDVRKDLPNDIPEQGSLDLSILLDESLASQASILEISMVQEKVFWAHNKGVPPLRIMLR